MINIIDDKEPPKNAQRKVKHLNDYCPWHCSNTIEIDICFAYYSNLFKTLGETTCPKCGGECLFDYRQIWRKGERKPDFDRFRREVEL